MIDLVLCCHMCGQNYPKTITHCRAIGIIIMFSSDIVINNFNFKFTKYMQVNRVRK